jgi:hypothetical protein
MRIKRGLKEDKKRIKRGLKGQYNTLIKTS